MTVREWLTRPVTRQWLLLLLSLGAATSLVIKTNAFWRADNQLYDVALPRGPAPDDVLIVAIDDRSVAELGRWPWRRGTLALALERLAQAKPKGILVDVLFVEPDATSPQDDVALAAVFARAPPTVLPLVLERATANDDSAPLRELLPIEPIRSAVTGLGHVHLEIDRDGIARSVFLREGLEQARWPHLALALLDATGDASARVLPGARHPAPERASALWRRDYHARIPFLGPPGHFRHVSLVDLLRGAIPDADLRNRLVLIGATAQGLGDAYPTPRSGESRAMPGVEITANVLAMLRSGATVRDVPRWAQHLGAWLVLLGVFFAFWRLAPRGALLFVAIAIVVVIAAVVGLLRLAGWWWPPAALLGALAIVYPLWSWRRLEATQGYLQDELSRLTLEPDPIRAAASAQAPRPVERFGDVVQQRIDLARYTAERLRSMRRFLWSTIASLPDATVVVGADGRVSLGNERAATLFGVADADALRDRHADELLAPVLRGQPESLTTLLARAPCAVESRGPGEAEYLIGIAPLFDDAGQRSASIVEFADVSQLKRAMRERQDLIRFLSHDMRSPQASIIALAQLQRDGRSGLSIDEFAAQTEQLATKSLALTEGFLALSRAEAVEPTSFAPLSLADVINDARDGCWATAAARGVTIAVGDLAPDAWANGSRDLLSRAVTNLVSNAIKYTKAGGRVEVRIGSATPRQWSIEVTDQGPGIAPESQGQLFQRFRRLARAGVPDPGGVGLGLAFVKLVAEKHGGMVSVVSDIDKGARFALHLPATAAPFSDDG